MISGLGEPSNYGRPVPKQDYFARDRSLLKFYFSNLFRRPLNSADPCVGQPGCEAKKMAAECLRADNARQWLADPRQGWKRHKYAAVETTN